MLSALRRRRVSVAGGVRVRDQAKVAVGVQQGAVLSELEPGTPVHVHHLMARDRLISGLSRATIVVEAGRQSGSMDTARKTLKQQRRLYAVAWDDCTTGREGLDDATDSRGLCDVVRVDRAPEASA